MSRWEALLWLATYLSSNAFSLKGALDSAGALENFSFAQTVVWEVNGEVSLRPLKRRALVGMNSSQNMGPFLCSTLGTKI